MKELILPEGRVSRIYSGDVLLWKREGGLKLYDYLQFSGTAYFNTGIVPNQDTVVEIVANDIVWNNTALFGGRATSRYRSLAVHLNRTQMLIDPAGSRLALSSGYEQNRQHIIVGAGSIAYTADTGQQEKSSYPPGKWEAPCPIALAALNTNGVISGMATYKLETFKITHNGALVLDGVPSVNSKGLFCLYNRAYGSFLLPTAGEVVCGNY